LNQAGPTTAKTAELMEAFNPDGTWMRVPENKQGSGRQKSVFTGMKVMEGMIAATIIPFIPVQILRGKKEPRKKLDA